MPAATATGSATRPSRANYNISQHTVKCDVESLLRKLAAASRPRRFTKACGSASLRYGSRPRGPTEAVCGAFLPAFHTDDRAGSTGRSHTNGRLIV